MANLNDPLRFVDTHAYAKAREVRIAELAYVRAQRRGFEPGGELEDWLAAERELDNLTSNK